MRIFIDIGHPAHVHYFKNFIKQMEEKGHEFLVTARDKEITKELLDHYKIKYVQRGRGANGFVGKVLYLFKGMYFLYKTASKFKPDISISVTAYTPFISKLLGVPNITVNDTEHATLHHFISFPFAKTILTPECYWKSLGEKQIRFAGYLELCYLHPNQFKPDLKILDLLEVKSNEKYVIFRFVSWNAMHDFGHSGISLEQKINSVKEISKYAKVFITSEGELPTELESYRIKIPPERMHDALTFASLLYGESATMASECACLGTPSIFHDNDGRGYTNEEEKEYGLVFNYSETLEDQKRAMEKAIQLLNDKETDIEWKKKSEKLIHDKIDVTAFFIWFVENYPKSVFDMKNNSVKIQAQFK